MVFERVYAGVIKETAQMMSRYLLASEVSARIEYSSVLMLQ